MTLSELVAAFRTRADDEAQPYLWEDTEVAQYLNEAEREAAERALLIHDETTAAVCTLTVVAGTASYPLHASILKIERATLASTGDTLTVTSRDKLDQSWPGWETATGTPQHLVEDGDGNATLVPAPTAADSVALAVKRLPLADMAADNDTPEIGVRHHYRMLDWALHLAFLKPDADAHNPKAADYHEARFERSFGYRNDANVQRKQRERRPHTTKSGW